MNDLQRDLIKLIKKYKPDRAQLSHILRETKRDPKIVDILGPVNKRKPKKLPVVPDIEMIRSLLDALEKDNKLHYRLMVKMLLYTGLRNSELVNLLRKNVNFVRNEIRVVAGKGEKDRVVPIFKGFRDELMLHMDQTKNNRYLFENKFNDKYSTNYIRMIFIEYRKRAGISMDIHPHSLRHFMLTHLTKLGWTDSEIKPISGHVSKKSLQVYQHLAPNKEKLDDALNQLEL